MLGLPAWVEYHIAMIRSQSRTPRTSFVIAATLACAAIAGTVLPGCSSGSDSSSTTASTASTTTVDPGAGSTTTADGGEIVETTFATTQGLPFSEPPVIKSSAGVLETTFDTKPTVFDVAGKQVKGMSYAGEFTGPTLLVNPGDLIRINLNNGLNDATNFHTHGMHVSPIGISDNVLRVMAPGTENLVEIQVPTTISPGTYWYHAHMHGDTEAQVFSGLVGALVVTGLTELLPEDLRSAPEHLLALRDLQLDESGTAIQTKDIDSGAPTTRTVNGLVNPVLTAQPGETQLLRLGNMSADIWYKLKMEGASFNVVVEDSNPVGTVWSKDTLLLPPGKRYDVLMRWDEPGSFKLVTLPYQTGPDGDSYPLRTLATVKVEGDPVPAKALPTSLAPTPDLENAEIAQRREVVFSEKESESKFFINGKQFEMGSVAFYPKLGTTEEWTIKNVTNEEHPFHIHVNDFQVMSVNGVAIPPLSLQDVVRLPAKGEVVIRMAFTDYVGKFVFHCHILAHEDHGMMAVVDVTENGGPPPAGSEESTTSMSESMPGM
ncbi:putative multicopper oxidase [Actinobacteria bacterium IMCC26207]|nr:putative multicopper oxidase [Actinobacteria bacterium IMCC26207]